MSGSRKVVVCQIGAREHYALPVALHEQSRLAALATDIWVPPGSMLGRLAGLWGEKGQRFAERYVAPLGNAEVISAGSIAQAGRILLRPAGWGRIMAHDRWFGDRTARTLITRGIFDRDLPPATFAYAYGALEILEAAESRGSPTLLGQIDPGPLEHDVVAEVAARHALPPPTVPPELYWSRWRRECSLADVIVVNSAWSGTLLARAGIEPGKIVVVPLALATKHGPPLARPPLPSVFTRDRPLQVLFLGRVGVRKGAIELLDAMARLRAAPIHLTLVGPIDVALRPLIERHSSVEVVGPVPRGATAAYYQSADVMILPTHSDGFAITQLEAQAAGLPVVVSTFCGRVVSDRDSGLVLPEVSAEAIADALASLVAAPYQLGDMAARAPAIAARFTPERAAAALLDCVDRALRVKG